MKRRNLLTTVLFCCTTVLMFQCSADKKNDEVTDTIPAAEAEKQEQAQDVTRTEAGKPQFTVDEIFRKQVTEVFDAYVKLKDAFVSSDADKVKKQSNQTLEALTKVDMKLVSGAAHSDWMNYNGEMSNTLKSISSSSDIEQQRTEFSKLSDTLYKTIKAYGLSGKIAYYEFCPMAFDDKGAHWLSEEQKIRNPYFGDKMLTCGSVQETLQ
jgi:transcriptional regulator with PAS, ATPase and Fis domain